MAESTEAIPASDGHGGASTRTPATTLERRERDGGPDGQPLVAVNKADLIAAWSFLERFVGSMRRIGRAYMTADAQTPLTPERRQQMLEDLDRFLAYPMARDAAAARRALADYLSDDEAEPISDSLAFFEPTPDA